MLTLLLALGCSGAPTSAPPTVPTPADTGRSPTGDTAGETLLQTADTALEACPPATLPCTDQPQCHGTGAILLNSQATCPAIRSIDDGCDEFIVDHDEPGCPPPDWSGFAAWSTFEVFILPYGYLTRHSTGISDPRNGDYLDAWIWYDGDVPIHLSLVRSSPTPRWCCDGNLASAFVFGDVYLGTNCD